MDWRLIVRVLVDGVDLSARFRPFLSSLDLTDGVGIESDELRIDLALGRTGAIMPFPRSGAEIDVFLGAGLSAARMGTFIADEFEASGPPDILSISAKAAVYDGGGGKTGLQDAKSRSWDAGTTISDLVTSIAGEHGLRAVVGESLRDIALDHIDQIDESDINLLTRAARDHGAFIKPSGGALVFAKLGESLSGSGSPLPVVALSRSDISDWRVSKSSRGVPSSCVATWRDIGAAIDQEAIAGSGEPVERLRHRFASREAAQRAADAALAAGKRGVLRISINLSGRADLVAEGRAILPPGLHPDLGGEWLITAVQHRVDSGGWMTSFDAEKPPT